MTEAGERGRTVEVPAYDLLRMAYDAIGTCGVLDYLAERGVVFARGDGEHPSGKRWKFVTEDHAPDLFGSDDHG